MEKAGSCGKYVRMVILQSSPHGCGLVRPGLGMRFAHLSVLKGAELHVGAVCSAFVLWGCILFLLCHGSRCWFANAKVVGGQLDPSMDPTWPQWIVSYDLCGYAEPPAKLGIMYAGCSRSVDDRLFIFHTHFCRSGEQRLRE